MDGGLGLCRHQATKGQRLTFAQGNVLGLLPEETNKKASSIEQIHVIRMVVKGGGGALNFGNYPKKSNTVGFGETETNSL